MESKMNSLIRNARPLLVGAIVVALVSAGGCRWFRSSDYQRSVENRPLEVPPDLDRPAATNALPLPGGQAAGETAGPPLGFVVRDTPEAVYARLGAALAQIADATVTGQSQGLGSYDIAYQGQNFVLKVENTAGQSRITAISPAGHVLRAGPAAQLLDQLRGKL
jgi:uncharacterized lipoprotein